MEGLLAIQSLLLISAAAVTMADSALLRFTLAFPDLTLRADWMREDCPQGTLGNIRILHDFSYADSVDCSFTEHQFIPVEYTDEIDELIYYGARVANRSTSCIQRGDCDVINMERWRELARQEYKVCSICNYEPEGPCIATPISKHRSPDKFHAIMDSMFLYSDYQCTVTPSTVLMLNAAVNHSVITLPESRCPLHNQPIVEEIVEQADSIRYRIRERYQLSKMIQEALLEGSSQLRITDSIWSIAGGYHWGGNTDRQVFPTNLYIYYKCIPMQTESLWEDGGGNPSVLDRAIRTDYFMITIAASLVIIFILVMIVFSMVFTIRGMRTCHQATMA